MNTIIQKFLSESQNAHNPHDPTSITLESIITTVCELAQNGMGFTLPNPLVGAMLVKDHKIIGRGFHRQRGMPHAEVEAIQDALNSGHTTDGAILFCTLEPCCHTSKLTPPCTKLIIDSQISGVVVGTLDPNPLVSGKGISFLKSQGIDVYVCEGALEEQCRQLNPLFNFHIVERFPYICLKWAQTLDGQLSLSPTRQYLSSEASLIDVHRDRKYFQNIFISGQTLRNDNPRLDCRFFDPRYTPNKFVFTELFNFENFQYEVFSNTPPEKLFFIVVENKNLSDSNKKKFDKNLLKLKELNVQIRHYVHSETKPFDLYGVFQDLYEENFVSFYVEPGERLRKLFFEKHVIQNQPIVKHCKIYVAPIWADQNALTSSTQNKIPNEGDVLRFSPFDSVDSIQRFCESWSYKSIGPDILYNVAFKKIT